MNCIICIAQNFLFNGVCINSASCPLGSYYSSQTCLQCHPTCAMCFILSRWYFFELCSVSILWFFMHKMQGFYKIRLHILWQLKEFKHEIILHAKSSSNSLFSYFNTTQYAGSPSIKFGISVKLGFNPVPWGQLIDFSVLLTTWASSGMFIDIVLWLFHWSNFK